MIQIIQPDPVVSNGQQIVPQIVNAYVPDDAEMYPNGTQMQGYKILGYTNVPANRTAASTAVVLPPIASSSPNPAVTVTVNPNPGANIQASLPAGTWNYINSKAVPNKEITDSWYGKLQLIVNLPIDGLEVGTEVIIKSNSGRYDGKHKIGYIYVNSTSKIAALYFSGIDFVTADTGTVTIASQASQPVLQVIKSATIDNQETAAVSAPVIANVDPNPGATAPVINIQQPVIKAAPVETVIVTPTPVVTPPVITNVNPNPGVSAANTNPNPGNVTPVTPVQPVYTPPVTQNQPVVKTVAAVTNDNMLVKILLGVIALIVIVKLIKK